MADHQEPAAAPEPNLADVWGRVKATLRRLGPAGPLALIASTLPAIGGFALLFLLKLIGPWLQAHGGLGVAVYIACFAALAGFALLPTYAQAILGGWAFGFVLGCPAAIAGVLGGALLGYAVGRRATGDRVVKLIAEHPKWVAVHEALIGSSFWKSLLIVALVRLPPSSPFAITNLALAALRVHPLAYTLGSLIGLAPRTGAAVFLAAGLKELTFDQPRQKWVWVTSIVLTLVVIAIIGHLANKAIAKVTAVKAE